MNVFTQYLPTKIQHSRICTSTKRLTSYYDTALACSTKRQCAYILYVVFPYVYNIIGLTKTRVFWKASQCMESKEKNHSKIHRRDASLCVCKPFNEYPVVLLQVFYCATIHFRTRTYNSSSRIRAICAQVIYN